MTYDWTRTLGLSPGTAQFYAAIDERFFRSSAHFGHPDYPGEVPFSRQIDYAQLRGRPVLEIGCGAGAMAAVMARQGLCVHAIDITRNAIELTRRRFELEGLSGGLWHADAEALPLNAASQAMVWSWGVIHHSANMQAIIDEIYRVLEPGGQAKVMVYHRHALRNWVLAGLNEGILRAKFLRRSYDDILREVTDGYIARHLTRRQVFRMFTAFDTVNIELTDFANLTYLPGNVLVDRFLSKLPVAMRLKRRWDAFIASRWGWFMYVEATK